MAKSKPEPVEYRYRSRSVLGAVVALGCGILSTILVALAINVHWWLWLMAAFAIVCTVLAFVAFAARSEFGCSVNDVELAWWSKRTWPPSHQKLPLVEIAKADMDDWGEEIQILLTTLDGQVLKIDGRFVGNGRDIFEAIVSRNQKIVATRNGKPIE